MIHLMLNDLCNPNDYVIIRCGYGVWIPYIFTSFSNPVSILTGVKFVWIPYIFTSFSNHWTSFLALLLFEYHTFLHHSQTLILCIMDGYRFEYHTFLHHSQTHIRINAYLVGLNTIHFYIILKLWAVWSDTARVWIQYIFT